jgi:sporulenol synthase
MRMFNNAIKEGEAGMSMIQVQDAIQMLTHWLITKQSADGSWRFCYESGVMTDAYTIIMLRSLKLEDEPLIHALHQRIKSKQEPNGAWKVFPDEEEGNMSASVEALFALLYSGYSQPSDPHIQQAKQYIDSHGGVSQITSLMTKIMLASCGQYPWPFFFPLPVELFLIPSASPLNFYDFSGYARVHLAPIILMADKRLMIKNDRTPELSDLLRYESSSEAHHDRTKRSNLFWNELNPFFEKLKSLPTYIHQLALHKAERYILDRLEADGTLYSYASATIFMIFALHSQGYANDNPLIKHAVQGLKSFRYRTDSTLHIQNTTSTVWDTALVSHALQQAGLTAEHPAVQSTGRYLLTRQHDQLGDWSRNILNPIPGGWGFSDINTINPDVDDTTAALRAICRLEGYSEEYRDAFNRGLQWIIAMQNEDGGWPAFEKNTDKHILTILPFNGADAAAIDPSTPDLTGRTLEFLGSDVGLTSRHPFISRSVHWLQDHQEADGSWYGRWGICYIYGTWAALTGMLAVGENIEHLSIQRGLKWLISVQNSDGGWGESCVSDQKKRYIALEKSTLSQSAWALDALIACNPEPNTPIVNGINYLLNNLSRIEQEHYPTGAGLPGHFYSRYHSYPYIWPLLALSHFRSKYET